MYYGFEHPSMKRNYGCVSKMTGSPTKLLFFLVGKPWVSFLIIRSLNLETSPPWYVLTMDIWFVCACGVRWQVVEKHIDWHQFWSFFSNSFWQFQQSVFSGPVFFTQTDIPCGKNPWEKPANLQRQLASAKMLPSRRSNFKTVKKWHPGLVVNSWDGWPMCQLKNSCFTIFYRWKDWFFVVNTHFFLNSGRILVYLSRLHLIYLLNRIDFLSIFYYVFIYGI